MLRAIISSCFFGIMTVMLPVPNRRYLESYNWPVPHWPGGVLQAGRIAGWAPLPKNVLNTTYYTRAMFTAL